MELTHIIQLYTYTGKMQSLLFKIKLSQQNYMNIEVSWGTLNCSFVYHQAPTCPKRIYPIRNDYTLNTRMNLFFLFSFLFINIRIICFNVISKCMNKVTILYTMVLLQKVFKYFEWSSSTKIIIM